MVKHQSDSGLVGEELQAALALAPFHKWLGLRIISSAAGRLELEMPWRDEVVSNPHLRSIHGGVLASLIDLCGMYAIITQTRDVTATAGLQVDYLRPAVDGPVIARAHVIKLGRTLSVAATELFSSAGLLLASGRGTYHMRTA